MPQACLFCSSQKAVRQRFRARRWHEFLVLVLVNARRHCYQTLMHAAV